MPKLSREDHKLVNRTLRAFLEELQKRFRALSPAWFRENPGARRPCDTCAMNPRTNRMQGWDSTAFHLQRAISQGQPFYCHKPLKPGAAQYEREEAVCAGYRVLQERDPALHEAFFAACMRTRR